METKSTELLKLSGKNSVIMPGGGLPSDVAEVIRKATKVNPSRAVLFETDKQRTLGALKKGLQKPGLISFEVLRRASMSVAVARICVTTLKEKVTKTQWIIKSKDPLKEADESKIEELTELLNNPNENDTWRSLLDMIMEDLLVLDYGIIEKTRYPDGKLGGLHYVDASTIRPVYDEFGNRDIPIEVTDPETHQVEEKLVSYVQVMNNSMYGGPESGEIMATWEKKDIIEIQQHPQGSMARFGYGLSPLESVLSVVNNLLNAENYNGSYFDEGAFPPIIMQLAGQIDQRNLEAYREYMYGELEGNFHRPVIMAGGGELKVHNLKDSNNRDMQFMEYTNWLAKLMCAAYGLSPQDIGLTDSVGGKNVAETQADLSSQKGYSSCLELIKEIVNNQIIKKDFGYKDLEFDWVEIDSMDPKIETDIHHIKLTDGSMTLNEVREEDGKTPYGSWADQPMILTADGYKPMIASADPNGDEENSDSDTNTVGEETVYREGDINTITKSQISKAVYTPSGYKTWFDDRGVSQPFIWTDIRSGIGCVVKPPIAVNLYSQGLECEITDSLASRGLNVERVFKTPYLDVIKSFPIPELMLEFDKYITMTSDYDSEKWRAKNGGSRKYAYYLTSNYIDGFSLNSKQIIDDMKRDPASYIQAINDLAALWNVEKDMMLGDRRADQYIITPRKRAFAFDYQFKGDKKRWEDTSTSIAKVLIHIPILYNLFMEKTAQLRTKPKEVIEEKKETVKVVEPTKKAKSSSAPNGMKAVMTALTSMKNKLLDKIKEKEEPKKVIAQPEEIPVVKENQVMFGDDFPMEDRENLTNLILGKDTNGLKKQGYEEMSYSYMWDASVKTLAEFILKNLGSSGGIVIEEDERGIRYCIYFRK